MKFGYVKSWKRTKDERRWVIGKAEAGSNSNDVDCHLYS